MTIWYILCSFFPVLISCTKKNLATLFNTEVPATTFAKWGPSATILVMVPTVAGIK
jgi:hypothetical protein